MDLILNAADDFVLTSYVYPASFESTDWRRQALSLILITAIGAYVTYYSCATFSYFFVFDKSLMQHPKFLKNQVKMEIQNSTISILLMSLPTAAVFLVEVRGYSKLYHGVGDGMYGWLFILFTIVIFVMFTDTLIYWIHRCLHHKLFYKHIHKPHHRFAVPTPFASHAMHPADGFLQGIPYHLYPFLFPLNKHLYVALFVFVNVWAVLIHDGDYRVPDLLKPFINGSAHHTDHHFFYNYNYGQFFTLWDRIGGSFKNPSAHEGKGPADTVKRMLAVKDN